MKTSVLFYVNYSAQSHIIINQGGTSAGKTYAILQVLFCFAADNENLVITVVGQDMPNLKAGAFRDAKNICSSSATLQAAVKGVNLTESLFEFHNGSLIEFKSYADAQDAKSGKRDYLFVNEANGVSWEIYSELALRTRERIYIDFNPDAAFWVHDQLLGRPGVELIISDHRHNPFLPEQQRHKIESLKETDFERWRVYARGLTGKISGLVLNNWEICEKIPDYARPVAAGLDFGFTNDETGCVMVYKQDGMLWVDELLYETRLTNPDISDRLIKAGLSKNTEIIADSAEPKSIEELKRMGWKITGARKGPDSVKISIDILKRYPIRISRRSKNLLNELGRYKWKKEPSGRVLNEPVDTCNHLIDPLRYIALNKLSIRNRGVITSRMPNIQSPAFDFASFNLLK